MWASKLQPGVASVVSDAKEHRGEGERKGATVGRRQDNICNRDGRVIQEVKML